MWHTVCSFGKLKLNSSFWYFILCHIHLSARFHSISPSPVLWPYLPWYFPLSTFSFGDRSSNALPTNRQSKFHLLTVKRLIFRNPNSAMTSLTLLFPRSFCHSQHDKIGCAYFFPSFLLSFISACYCLLQSPHSVPPPHSLSPPSASQTGSDF